MVLPLLFPIFGCSPADSNKDDEAAGAAGAAAGSAGVSGSSGQSGEAGAAGDAGAAGQAGASGSGAGAGGESGASGQAGSGGEAGAGGAGGEAGASGASGASAGGDAGAGGEAGAGGTAAGAGGSDAGAGGAVAGAGGSDAGAGGEAGQGGEGGAAGQAGAGGSGAGAGGESGASGQAGSGGGGALSWKKFASPCGGNKINALWFDDASKGFAGCGELAAGKGFYSTTDGGQTWKSHPKFGEVRVVDVRRGSDGVLYGAGTHTVEGFSAWKVDESSPSNLKVVGLYTPSNQAFTSVGIGENIARTDDGKLLVDSLTGGSAALQPAGGAFTEYYSLNEALIDDPDALEGFAPRKITSLGNDFYATGNKINEPARVFLPTKKSASSGYYFQPIDLQGPNEDGEPYDLHAWSPTSIIVAGWDRSYNYPLIFVADGDPYDKASWKHIDLLDSGLEWQGGILGLGVAGDVVVAVGQKLPGEKGFVIRSADRGKTWSEVTPGGVEGTEVLWRTWLFGDGRIVAAGGGELWVYGAELTAARSLRLWRRFRYGGDR